MRLVYLDEAGISKPTEEPVLVVAGVIVNPDRQWRQLEAYFRDLANDLFPDEDPYRFVFHAKDIFHGSGPFDRERWPRKDRMKILAQLAQVPRLFDLPIVIGDIDKAKTLAELVKVAPSATAKSSQSFMHVNAFINAIQRVQFWVEKNAPEETAMIIVEDTPTMKGILKNVHEGYTDKSYDGEEAFRAPNIIDAAHFAKKQDSLLLQIADHCAFILKRKLSGKSDVDEAYAAIRPYVQLDFNPVKRFTYRVTANEIELVDDPEEVERMHRRA